MPAVAIIGAIALDAMAAGAVISTGLTVMTAFEVVAAVGATVGAIGVIARDKGLQKAGMIIGAIGAVGGLATAAGLIPNASFSSMAGADASAGAAGSIATDADIVDSVTITPGLFGSEAGAGAAAVVPVAPVQVAPLLPGAPAGDLTAATPAGTGLINQAASPATTVAAPVTTTPSSAVSTPAAAASNVTGAPSAESVLNKPWGAPDTISASGTVLSGPDQSSLQGMLQFAKANPMVTYGMMQTGGSLLSGLFDQVSPAQVAALNAQAAANRATAAITQNQANNMNQPLPTASRGAASVTGVPAGLINTPRQAANVTGVAAA